MDGTATDKSWHFTTERGKTMTRTTYIRTSMVLAAMTVVAMVTILLATQKPAAAGIIIGPGDQFCWPAPGVNCPPDTEIISGPSGTVYVDWARFSFSAWDDFVSPVGPVKLECRLDGGAWETSCTSPKDYTGLSEGSHTFQVRAIDSAGNVDASPASHQFTVDTTPPETTITSPPPDPSGTMPTFRFYSSDDVAYFYCMYHLSSGSWGSWRICSSPYTLPRLTTSGTYTFHVYAVDKAGNRESEEATHTWTVDATAPSAPIITGPPNNSFDTDGSFTVSGTAENGSTVRLFEGAASRGTAEVGSSGEWSMEVADAPEGSHSYTARATDVVGNMSVESEARTVIVDSTAPDAPSIVSPAEGNYDNDGSFIVSGTAEANSTVELSESTTPKGTATANDVGDWSIELTGVTEGSHAYTARATDAVGHVSAESETRTVIVDTTGPTVRKVAPAENGMGIAPGANVSALFSEVTMEPTFITANFKLYKKGSTAVAATVTYDAVTNRAVLNPKDNLKRGATYKAVVGAGVQDLAGNTLLDQDPNRAGDQPKAWFFTVRA